jgi:hypothetical protein
MTRHALAILVYLGCILASFAEIEESIVDMVLVENWRAAHAVILLSAVRLVESCVHLVERAREFKSEL